jgi:putative transposase
MGRPLRVTQGGYVYHVLNRANARLPLFTKPGDFDAFERVLVEARERFPMPILAYCIMPNHWHLLLWPQQDGLLSRVMNWLTLTHTQRWHAHRGNTGSGHLYQGRFKSFLIEEDQHFLVACRYVERNALRAGLVRRAEDWRWSSLWRRQTGSPEEALLLSPWPVPCPRAWVEKVNEPQTQAELTALRRSVQRGQPFGSERWLRRIVGNLGLETTLRPRGRPRKAPAQIQNKGS